MEQIYQTYLRSTGICTDTRRIGKNNLFVALKGPNFNANEFAEEALDKGCSAAIVDEEQYAVDERFILVDDGLTTLQNLATHHRRQRKEIPFIGITGSNGKTTTKELVYAVLSKKLNVHATKGNLNNHIGVPLTLLELKPEHELAIIEMGANKQGDIEELCAIAEPDLGLITNIGEAHLEGMGGIEGVLKTKTELYASIRSSGGHVFVNADSDKLMRASSDLSRLTYGIGSGELSASHSEQNPFLLFKMRYEGTESDLIRTNLFGIHNLTNALAAARIGLYFNVPMASVIEAISEYDPDNNRSQWTETDHNAVIMDAYNANPTSVLAAIESLAQMTSERRKLAILGDMFELGAESADGHRRVVQTIRELGLDAILIGPEYANCAGDITSYHSTEEALDQLRSDPIRDRCILVKGSRGMALERLYDLL